MAKKRVYRSQEDCMIAGVCGGIAERFNWDPVWVRLAAVLLIFAHGIGLLLYVVAWIIMPVNPDHRPGKRGTAPKPSKGEPKQQRKGHKVLWLTLLVILSVVALVAAAGFVVQALFCLTGSGNVVSEERVVEGFDKVELAGSGTLVVTQGDEFHVSIEGDDNLLAYYNTEVRGQKLSIGMEPFRCVKRSSGLNVMVTMPDVEQLSLLGSGDIKSLNTLTADALDLEIAGSGTIDLAVNVTDLDTEIAGSGEAYYQGSAVNHEISIAGSGDIFAFDLVTNETSVEIAGSGDAEVHALSVLDIDIAGSGDIRYKGEPLIDQDIAGSGDIARAES
jgi:phage shock protein PspC (stress-responsive transcriptional regulator)